MKDSDEVKIIAICRSEGNEPMYIKGYFRNKPILTPVKSQAKVAECLRSSVSPILSSLGSRFSISIL